MNPPRVDNVERFWSNPPPVQSPRCTHWIKRFANGWRPNRRISGMGYHESAEYYGVKEQAKIVRGAEGIDCEICADSGFMSRLNAKGDGMDVHPCLCERGKVYPS